MTDNDHKRKEAFMKGQRYAAFACSFAALICAGCSETAPAPEAVRPVRAIKVGDLKAISGREFPGRAEAVDDVDLSFRVAGPLVSLPVDVGTEVKAGDVIASVDSRDYQSALDSAQGNLERARANLLAMERGARPEEIEALKAALQQAEASYQQAYTEHERNAKLLEKEAISKSEFDLTLARAKSTAAEIKKAQEDLNIGQAGARPEDLEAKRAEIKALEAAVTNAKNQLDYTVLKAPFDGQVSARYVDNFQTVQAKEPIARLLDISRIEVTIQLPESLISLVPQVKKVACRFDAFPDRDFFGGVTKIGSEASQTTRTYPVTIQIEQPEDVQILPGMAATVRNQPQAGDETPVHELVVPPSAVFTGEAGGQTCVWVVDEGSQKVSQRKVATGALTAVGIAVTEGLNVGEWVVTAGVNLLQDGQAVTILQEGSR
jgi:RND family efflux transporter MFP subunit